MAMEHNEYFIHFNNAEVNVQREGRRKQARRGGGNALILQRRESNDPINSPCNAKSGFNIINALSGMAVMKGGEGM